MRTAIVCALCLGIQVFAQNRPAPTEFLPTAFLHQAYYHQLRPPTAGTPPWRWLRIRGAFPPGITLRDGTLAGVPTSPGEFRFTLQATDSSPKPLTVTRDYVLRVPSPLTVNWTQPPHVTPEGGIAGELQVTNASGSTVDLTVIVVAVNTINKAFALGYQHFSFDLGVQRIPFGSTLPRDTYVVHADAIAEIAQTGDIYRARLQTDPLTVP